MAVNFKSHNLFLKELFVIVISLWTSMELILFILICLILSFKFKFEMKRHEKLTYITNITGDRGGSEASFGFNLIFDFLYKMKLILHEYLLT